MADEDEIDILGEFSFNSCLAQNNQGIPSCSDREDTVHPEWLLDSTANNWYDIRNRDRASTNDGPSRILSGSSRVRKYSDMHTMWTLQERRLLLKEMAKYGRNVRKISQTIKTKTEAEIQALIEAEHGIRLDTPSFGLDKTNDDLDDVPSVVQEEIVTEEDVPSISHVINMVTTGTPTITIPNKQPFKKKNIIRPKNSLLKPNILLDVKKTGADYININPSEIFYEDDLILGSTESVASADTDSLDAVSKKLTKTQKTDNKPKPKATKKIGNHRRKNSRNYDKETVKIRNKSKDNLKSPHRVRKDSSLSEDSTKSPKLQIVFSSGQALPVSEGEQVIKIEKKKDSEPESDIEIDIDSDNDEDTPKVKSPRKPEGQLLAEEPIAVPLRKFEPMPRRQKKINLDGEGGFTIMHTESGDLYEIGAEPRRERSQKKAQTHLIQCRLYNSERPPPYEVRLCTSALICMDVQAHTSRAEVMGLLGGELQGGAVTFRAYRPAAAAASRTHCDMDPVSQALAAESLRGAGYSLIGWHHSHPSFPPAPSALDLRTQSALQTALERPSAPFLALITSQHWPTGRAASQYRCFRVETTPDELEAGFQLSVKLVADLCESSLPALLHELNDILRDDKTEFSVDMTRDTCPQAGVTYLEKCISSVSHHLRSAGYAPDDPIVGRLVQGLRDVFR